MPVDTFAPRDERPGTIDVTPDGPHWVARLSGEVDAAVVETFALSDPTHDRQEAVVATVDAADVSFLDSSGLSLLLRWATRARRDGVTTHLRSASPAVRDLLRLSGTDALFTVAGAPSPRPAGPKDA